MRSCSHNCLNEPKATVTPTTHSSPVKWYRTIENYLCCATVASPAPTPPSPHHHFHSISNCSTTPVDKSSQTEISMEDQVRLYLLENRHFLEEFVMQQCDIETLERWVIRHTQRNNKRQQQQQQQTSSEKPLHEAPRKTSLSRWKFCVHADKRKMLQELTQSLYLRPSKVHVLSELAATIASAVNADGWYLMAYDKSTQELKPFRCDDSECKCSDQPQSLPVALPPRPTLGQFVVRMKEPIRIISGQEGSVAHRSLHDLRFADDRSPSSETTDDGCSSPTASPVHILAHPVIQPDGEITGVLELYRKAELPGFYEEDEEIVNSYLVWGGIALHYAEMYSIMARQRKLHSFLLAVVRSIFQDMVSMDSVIVKIMTFARKLVSADRASLFLLDQRTRELYARIFDVSSADEAHDVAKEIRFPVGTGIAGVVAETGESLNIPSVYEDARFNRAVDQQTGYTTKSLLCMPIFIRGSVIGVVQMVNKLSGGEVFTKSDEEAFATFATYCGLALHHAKLYDKIRRSEQKYKVALEVLSYHATCTDDEIAAIKELKGPWKEPDVSQLALFSFSTNALNCDEKVTAAIAMFNDLFKPELFDQDSLLRFVLTVRKNYRRVPYHNWAHGFTVANACFAIIKSAPGVFKPLEELCLYVSCLCHDLDHRGKTNQFLQDFASPLANIYTTSTLEHHHFNQTVQILQQSGHNILKSLTSEEYKQVLSNIKHCILATDLANYFPNKTRLKTLVETKTFDENNQDHRLLLQAITMTACDLCASSKPWDQQRETVRVIFEEFYEQGDIEKAAGRQPIPMMDRDQAHQLPASQVGFISGICIPCYEVLAAVVPGSAPLMEGCKENLQLWQQLAKEELEKQKEQRSPEVESPQLDSPQSDDAPCSAPPILQHDALPQAIAISSASTPPNTPNPPQSNAINNVDDV